MPAYQKKKKKKKKNGAFALKICLNLLRRLKAIARTRKKVIYKHHEECESN